MFEEWGARRKRLRASLGDRGQGLVEFLVLGGVLVGSIGLFVRTWMPAAAPWGFAIPFVFVIGFLLIDARRQAAMKREAPATPGLSNDWIVLLWSLACALAGVAAFIIAWSAEPATPPGDWAPPESAVSVDISP